MSFNVNQILSALKDSEALDEEELAKLIRECLKDYPILNFAIAELGATEDWLHILMFLLNIEGAEDSAVGSLLKLRGEFAKTTNEVIRQAVESRELAGVGAKPQPKDLLGNIMFMGAQPLEVITMPGWIHRFFRMIALLKLQPLIIWFFERRTQYKLRVEARDRVERLKESTYYLFQRSLKKGLNSFDSEELEALVAIILAAAKDKAVSSGDFHKVKGALMRSSPV